MTYTAPQAAAVRVVLRPMASPLPIGFLALAVGSFALSGLQLAWIPETQGHAVAWCLIAFVVPLQFVSFVLGLMARDEGSGTGMGLLTGSWLAIGLVMLHAKPGSHSGALGLLLIASAAALLVPVLTAFGSKAVASAVIATTVVRFGLAGIYQLDGGSGWKVATGVVGVLLAVLAWYVALALALEDAQGHAVLPTFRQLPASDLPGDTVPDALRREAGVRRKV
jgi:succinate-acetate transporter protein